MLSKRAQKYLSRLKRISSVPTREVEEMLLEQEIPPLDVWLSFHEHYAGYVEKFGYESATWGLSHKKPHWREPETIECEHDDEEQLLIMACADVHPSYSYQITETGVFYGCGGACSFEKHIERTALGEAFAAQGATYHLVRKLEDREFISALLEALKQHLVLEASDECYRVYMNSDYYLAERVFNGALRVWSREPDVG